MENTDFRLKFFNEAIVGKIIKKIHIRINLMIKKNPGSNNILKAMLYKKNRTR